MNLGEPTSTFQDRDYAYFLKRVARRERYERRKRHEQSIRDAEEGVTTANEPVSSHGFSRWFTNGVDQQVGMQMGCRVWDDA